MSGYARTLQKRMKAEPGPNARAKLAEPAPKRAPRGSRRGTNKRPFGRAVSL